jgi:carbonic anhydrase/acetyltransferase-like protein (isoleucine patch superfamily)
VAIYELGSRRPQIHHTAFVHDTAVVIGDVRIGAHASIWPGAVLRGDNDPITIGDDSNVQDGSILHTDTGVPLLIGNRVTIGHQCCLHGCTIGDGSLIGMQAVLLNHSVIGAGSLVGACSLVTERKQFAAGSMILGSPARLVRSLSAAEIEDLLRNARSYVSHAEEYRHLERRI